jgi:putative acetyltransferase
MTNIRFEREEDLSAIRRVNELAFGQPNEADLVDALRINAHPHISLVAVDGEEIVGHIFFSPVTIQSEKNSFTAMGLAPMAVLPERQNQGIGSLLVREGLKECQRIGHDIVVVLGHRDYYPRFGFVTAKTKGLSCEYPVPDEYFMVTELSPNALNGRSGLVIYHSEFSKV